MTPIYNEFPIPIYVEKIWVVENYKVYWMWWRQKDLANEKACYTKITKFFW
jgi:hypothetical protein